MPPVCRSLLLNGCPWRCNPTASGSSNCKHLAEKRGAHLVNVNPVSFVCNYLEEKFLFRGLTGTMTSDHGPKCQLKPYLCTERRGSPRIRSLIKFSLSSLRSTLFSPECTSASSIISDASSWHHRVPSERGPLSQTNRVKSAGGGHLVITHLAVGMK